MSSLIDIAIKKLYGYVDQRVEDVRPFRAIVIGQSSGMVQIRRIHSTTGETALRARVVGFDLATNDEVLCVPMADGIPVVIGKVQRSTAASLGLSAGLKSLNTPYLDTAIANSATTGSTTDTNNYSVNVTMSLVLPTGTWTVFAWGTGVYAHSVANGIVRVHMQVGSDAGTAMTSACAIDPGRTAIAVHNAASAQTGTITVAMEYRPNATGTAYAGGGSLTALAVRTA